MKRFAILAAIMLGGIAPAMASEVVAERVVVTGNTVLTLQLSDQKADGATACRYGNLAARMLAARVGDQNSTQRINLGCWLVNRDGSIEYSAVDQNTGRDIHIQLTTNDFKTTRAFKSWGAYMGPFLLSNAQQ